MVIPLIFPSTRFAAVAHSTESDQNETNPSFPRTSAFCVSGQFLLRQQVRSRASRADLSNSGALKISLSTKNYYYHNDSNPVTSRAGRHGPVFQFVLHLLHQRHGSTQAEAPSSLQGVRSGTGSGQREVILSAFPAGLPTPGRSAFFCLCRMPCGGRSKPITGKFALPAQPRARAAARNRRSPVWHCGSSRRRSPVLPFPMHSGSCPQRRFHARERKWTSTLRI